MELLAGGLMVGAAISFSFFAVWRRQLLNAKVLNVTSFVFASTATASAVAFLGVPLWNGLGGVPFRWRPEIFWFSVIGTVVVNHVIQYANAKASSLAEASLTAPIQALTPGLVTIAAWLPWVGETPTLQGVAGIALISICNYIHSREDATTLGEYLRPFTFLLLPANFSLVSEERQRETRKQTSGLRWAYLSAACGTIGLIFDGLLTRNGNPILGIACKWALVSAPFAPGGSSELRALLPLKQRHAALLVVTAGAALGFGELLTAFAFRFAPIASVGSLKRLTIPLTVLLAWWILSERKAKRRIWPALGVALGAALLALDGSIGVLIQQLESD